MGSVAEIITAAYEVLDGGQVSLTQDERGLGMAYAIPADSVGTVVDAYGPWSDAEIREVFYKESSIFGSVLAEIQLIMTWRCSAAQQYIIEAYLTPNVISLDPTADAKIGVRFDQPQNYDYNLEAYEIPFQITVQFDPVGGDDTTVYRGRIRADGSGSVEQL